MAGCGSVPGRGCVQEAVDQCFSLTPVLLSALSPSLPLSLKSTSMASGEDLKKNWNKIKNLDFLALPTKIQIQ